MFALLPTDIVEMETEKEGGHHDGSFNYKDN